MFNAEKEAFSGKCLRQDDDLRSGCLGVAEILSGVLRAASELFFNAEYLIVFGKTFTTARCTSLDLKPSRRQVKPSRRQVNSALCKTAISRSNSLIKCIVISSNHVKMMISSRTCSNLVLRWPNT
jgi:hypothetical protein